MILYDFKCGLNESQTFERLTQAFGDLALRVQQFSAGLVNLRGGEHHLKMRREVGGQQQL
ncbi:hypothetical protein C0J52_04971 [Blattella germanica]|nr:hypothetical protein C0J52_04971 [Blattella germanica]